MADDILNHSKECTSMFDVVSVRLLSRKVGLIARNKSEADADTVIEMAIKRQGLDDQFFAKAKAGLYRDNDPWKGPDGE
jgi:hypothetical protein